MTISSVLVGYATGDQRQISAAESTGPASADAILALKTGPWSAIDWGFGSVLQALMPDTKDGAVQIGADGEKVDPLQVGGVPTAATQTPGSVPKGLPANLLLAFQRAGGQGAVVQQSVPTPVAPAITTPVEVSTEPEIVDTKPVETTAKIVVTGTDLVRATPRFLGRVELQSKDGKLSAIPLRNGVPHAAARTVPVRTSDVAPVLLLSVLPAGEIPLETQDISAAAVRTSDIVPTLIPSPFPPDILVVPAPNNTESSATPTAERTLEAEIVSPPAVPAAAMPLSDPLPPVSRDAPAAETTLEAEIVTAPFVRTFDVVPTHVPSQTTNVESEPVPVEQAPVAGPESQPASPKSKTVNPAPAPRPSLDSLPIHTAREAVPVKENPSEASPVATRIDPQPIEPQPPAAATVAAPTLAVQATEIQAQPVAAPSTQREPAHVDKAPVRTQFERPERTNVPPSDIDSVKKTSAQTVELQMPRAQAPVPTPAPVLTADKKSDDAAPTVTEAAADQPLPAPVLTDSKESSSPSLNPIVVAQVPQAAGASAAVLRPNSSERRSDDPPKSQPTGLMAVEAMKPEPGPVQVAPDRPTPTADKKSADSGQAPIAESTSKTDPPSPNDTEIAFTGRLVPRKAADEPVSRPDTVEPKLDKISAPPLREMQETPLERPVEQNRSLPRIEPAVVVSTVHHETAPAPADRPAETVHSPRTANNEIIQEPVKNESSGPVHEISMRFNDQTQDSAHLRVVEKGGEVLVSVRSGSEQLARTLSSDLGDLAHRLEQTGFQAELYRPSAASSSSEPGQDRRDNASTTGQNASQPWSRDRRDSQQHPGQHAREWADDLEESMGLSQ